MQLQHGARREQHLPPGCCQTQALAAHARRHWQGAGCERTGGTGCSASGLQQSCIASKGGWQISTPASLLILSTRFLTVRLIGGSVVIHCVPLNAPWQVIDAGHCLAVAASRACKTTRGGGYGVMQNQCNGVAAMNMPCMYAAILEIQATIPTQSTITRLTWQRRQVAFTRMKIIDDQGLHPGAQAAK